MGRVESSPQGGVASSAGFAFRRLEPADLDAFAALHEQVRASSPPGSLSHRDRAECARLLGCLAVGAFAGERLAGFACAMPWRAIDAPRFLAIGLPRERWDRTAVLVSTAVADWARGRGLQRLLLGERARRLHLIGATHGAGLIHCDNRRSLRNTLSGGEPLRGILDDEDGANYVSWRVARCDPGPLAGPAALRLAFEDEDAHREAFSRGLWCWAFEAGERDDPGVLVFAPPDPACE